METREPFGHRHHRFAQRDLNRFEPFPRRSGTGLIPDAQTLLGRLQGQPDIPLTVAFAHAQGLIEQADPALRRDAAHRMDVARLDRQTVRQARGIAWRERVPPRSLPHALRCIGLARGDILRAVPREKGTLNP